MSDAEKVDHLLHGDYNVVRCDMPQDPATEQAWADDAASELPMRDRNAIADVLAAAGDRPASNASGAGS